MNREGLWLFLLGDRWLRKNFSERLAVPSPLESTVAVLFPVGTAVLRTGADPRP